MRVTLNAPVTHQETKDPLAEGIKLQQGQTDSKADATAIPFDQALRVLALPRLSLTLIEIKFTHKSTGTQVFRRLATQTKSKQVESRPPSHVNEQNIQKGRQWKEEKQVKEEIKDWPSFHFLYRHLWRQFLARKKTSASLEHDFNFNLISPNFKAVSKPCKPARKKNRDRTAMKGRETRKRRKKRLTLLLYRLSSPLETVSGEKKGPLRASYTVISFLEPRSCEAARCASFKP